MVLRGFLLGIVGMDRSASVFQVDYSEHLFLPTSKPCMS